jgi:hypothetical protein
MVVSIWLTLFSLSCLSYGDVIYGISCLYSLNYFSYGDVICGTIVVYLTAYIAVSTTNGSILPLIIFCALKFVLSYSLFTHKLEAPPSSTLLFLLKALLGESTTAFFMFSSAIYISSLVLLTLAGGFYGLSF